MPGQLRPSHTLQQGHSRNCADTCNIMPKRGCTGQVGQGQLRPLHALQQGHRGRLGRDACTPAKVPAMPAASPGAGPAAGPLPCRMIHSKQLRSCATWPGAATGHCLRMNFSSSRPIPCSRSGLHQAGGTTPPLPGCVCFKGLPALSHTPGPRKKRTRRLTAERAEHLTWCWPALPSCSLRCTASDGAL